MKNVKTIGELKASGYVSKPIREEMRFNLIRALKSKERLFPGIIGYDETVIPHLENAILSGHHMIFLGERGQGKTRMIRSLTNLLDPFIPVIAGCEIGDDPLRPICAECCEKVKKDGDNVKITWLSRESRYSEKLATPDVSIADLIGEIDPIKVAEGRYLSDELTIHFGLIPRTNRGIFAINELPDLQEKVQVGLFNIMEEGDVQIKGYKIRLPLDICIVASANPEDYTSRGRIITPLKDRFESQIRTHYPKDLETEISIMEQEKTTFADRPKDNVPQFIKDIIGELTFTARHSPEVSQRSGVSVRLTITNYENILSNAEKRAILNGENEIVPRISDFHALYASTNGKLEFEYMGEDKKDSDIIQKIITKAVRKVFDRHFTPEKLSKVVDCFKNGWVVEVSDTMPSSEYLECLSKIDGLKENVSQLVNGSASNGIIASSVEFIFEGLHLYNKLNKNEAGGKIIYK
ncbi:MAG: magnesium chelatase [Candidatus Schekmanbacteria bacterium]|nr:magnesium chelatase [Candidatus Schekmanbacteria bacterium]